MAEKTLGSREKITRRSTDEREAANTLPVGICIGALIGFATQIAVICVSAFALSKLENPAVAFDSCAIMSSAFAGLVAGKTASKRCPEANRTLCGIGAAAVMAAVILLLSCIFVPDTFEAWVPYTSLGTAFLFSFLGVRKSKKGRKRNANSGINRKNKKRI